MTQEFHLSITPLGQDRYLVRTEEVAPGVPLAEEQVAWPVERWLQESAAQASDPLLSLLQENSLGSGRTAAIACSQGPLPEGSQLIALGQTLYNALFQGRIRDSWLAAQGVAQNRRQVLRLRLGFKDSRLQRLPWEVLYADDRPLATGTDIVFARYYAAPNLADLTAMPTLPTEGQALQVLMVVCAPDDQERLALRQEVQHLRDELHPASPPGVGWEEGSKSRPTLDIQLTILEQPGRAELVQALEQGQYQVLHYAGHSDVSETGGDLYLVSRQTGLTERLSGEDLAGLLVNNGIRLAVFNSCRGAYTAVDDAEAGWREQNLVQALMNRGVPGVIAMAERIPDDVAVTFTRLIYRNLRQKFAIDLSLSRTRQGLITTYGSDQSYWMLPILYLQPEFDGYLFARDRNPDWHEAPLNPLDSWLLNGDGDVEGNHQDNGTALPLHDLPPLPGETPLEVLLEDFVPIEAGTDLTDLLDALGSEDEPSYEEDAAVVTDLIQQLSSGQTAAEAPLAASQTENLLPDWPPAQGLLYDTLPDRSQHSALMGNPTQSALAALDSSQTDPGNAAGSADYRPYARGHQWRRWLPSAPLLAWVGLGLGGAIAALVLATSLASHYRTSPEPPSAEAGATPLDSGPLVTNALQVIQQGDPEAARPLLETLLDNGDLKNVAAVLATTDANTVFNSPDLLFIRGRLGWEQIAQSNDTFSADDVRRDWERAVDKNPKFLEAWIALGFAYAYLEQPDQAIQTWQRAIDLDRSWVRDGEPGTVAIANPDSLHARVGLAMTYYQLSQLAPDSESQTRLQEQALEQYRVVVAKDATLLDVNTLSRSWFWLPDSLDDWRQAVEALTRLSQPAASS